MRTMLAGFPEASGYEVIVKALRYRTQPSLSALTDLEGRTMTIRVPEPFHPFGEIIRFGAVRVPGKRMRFVPLTEGVSFRTPREVVRFLYLHEWMHCYLYERTGRGLTAETTCDRFALLNYRRRAVSERDARAALRRDRDAEARAVDEVDPDDPGGARPPGGDGPIR